MYKLLYFFKVKIIMYVIKISIVINNTRLQNKLIKLLNSIDCSYYEKYAKEWHCNCCGNIVFKGIVKYGILITCPHCGSRYQVICKYTNKHYSRSTIMAHKDNTIYIQEDDLLDTGIRYDTNILGTKYNVRG